MKKRFGICVLLFIVLDAYPVMAQWQWAQSGTSATSWDEGYGITVDAAGNAYVTGMFSSASIDFGSLILSNVNSGTDDIFLVKYGPSGIPLWARRAGGNDYDYAMAVQADAQP